MAGVEVTITAGAAHGFSGYLAHSTAGGSCTGNLLPNALPSGTVTTMGPEGASTENVWPGARLWGIAIRSLDFGQLPGGHDRVLYTGSTHVAPLPFSGAGWRPPDHDPPLHTPWQ